jgi:signal transduction histidine kinase/CHASE3 domain sensor protein/DNA-binding response OmpR family regulator
MQATRSKISFTYLFVIIILLALVSLSNFDSSRNMETQSNTIANDALPISNAANNLLTDLINQETGIRGFLVTADENFLESFTTGKIHLDNDLQMIRGFEAKYPELRNYVENQAMPIINRLQEHYNNQVILIKNSKIVEARGQIQNGKNLMDQYRVVHEKIQQVVTKISDTAQDATHLAGKRSRSFTFLGGLIAIFVGIMSAIIFVRANRSETALRKSEETYRYMAESLEAQNEEIIAQQEEQQITLAKLSEREQELELITSYQEKLTGYVELKDFLKHSLPALLDSIEQDAALVVMELEGEPRRYEVIYSCGYPIDFVSRKETELFGPSKRVFEEGKPFLRKRELTEKERGLHEGRGGAADQYFPLFDDNQKVIGFLLVTNYHSNIEDNQRLARGIIRQFGLAFYAQLMNEDRRKQALYLEELNDQLLLEKQLIEDQRDLIESILEASHEGMMMCDSNGTILFSNQRMRRYFDLHLQIRSNLVERCQEISAAVPSFSSVSSSVDALIQGGIDQLTQRFNFDYNEQLQHAELYATIVGEGTEQKGYLFVFRDRTEEERIDEMKNEFVSIVSHELRTPLASVLGFIEILLNRDLSQEKQKKYMETIYKEAHRLSNLINDFLDLQRMESGHQVYHFSPIDLAPMVQEVVEQWQGKQHHQIMLHYDHDVLLVKADADRIRQVIHNLVSNAIKYSPSADKVDVRIEAKGAKVTISVQDYGLGIPEDARGQLFTKFFRVDNSDRRQIGGTGLGLAIVKEIIEAHHGHISFVSEMGKGTTFTVELTSYELASLDGKIVIFEDDDNLARLIQVALGKLNLPSAIIRSAEEGILSLQRLQDGGPILFIVDIVLEGNKTGWDFLAELYRHPVHHQTPVIVSTALEPPQDYHEKEIEKYLKKPFTMERLVQVAQSLLENNKHNAYVFPAQNTDLIASSLQRNGIEVSDIKENQDMIEVEIKKRSTNDEA